MPSSDLELFPLLQIAESAVNDLIFLGVAVFFLSSLEARVKRHEALRALHQLRSLAHVIDMHQLTKDPEQLQDSPPGCLRRCYGGRGQGRGRGGEVDELRPVGGTPEVDRTVSGSPLPRARGQAAEGPLPGGLHFWVRPKTDVRDRRVCDEWRGGGGQ